MRILANSRGAKPSKIVIKDSIKTWRQLALAGEALHPDAVSDQQVVEGAMQGLEESAAVGAIVSVRHLGGGIIEPFVAPSVMRQTWNIAFLSRSPEKPSAISLRIISFYVLQYNTVISMETSSDVRLGPAGRGGPIILGRMSLIGQTLRSQSSPTAQSVRC